MLISFRVRQRVDGKWIPDHPELVPYYAECSSEGTILQIREMLFSLIDEQVPNTYTLDMPVEEAMDYAFKLIDARTTAIINAGFVFEGIRFSVSVKAQVRYATMLMVAASLQYPLGVNSLDDHSFLDLTDANHTAAFCMTALGYVKQAIDSGTEQKDAIRGMSDATLILGYEDPRTIPG
jgi:hypothetical protein